MDNFIVTYIPILFFVVLGIFSIFLILNTISSHRWLKPLFYLSSLLTIIPIIGGLSFFTDTRRNFDNWGGFFFIIFISVAVLFSIISFTFYCCKQKIKKYKIYTFLGLFYLFLLIWALKIFFDSSSGRLYSLSLILLFGAMITRCARSISEAKRAL